MTSCWKPLECWLPTLQEWKPTVGTWGLLTWRLSARFPGAQMGEARQGSLSCSSNPNELGSINRWHTGVTANQSSIQAKARVRKSAMHRNSRLRQSQVHGEQQENCQTCVRWSPLASMNLQLCVQNDQILVALAVKEAEWAQSVIGFSRMQRWH